MAKLVEVINAYPSLAVSVAYIPNRGWVAQITGLELSDGTRTVTCEHQSLTQSLDNLAARLSGRRITILHTGTKLPPFKYVGF